MKPKKREIKNLDEVLKDIPEEDRASLRKQIEKLFSGDTIPGKPVRELPTGSNTCTLCAGPLKQLRSLAGNPEVVDMFECDACDECFMRPAAN